MNGSGPTLPHSSAPPSPEPARRRSRLSVVLRWLLTLLVLTFVVLTLRQLFGRWDARELRLDWPFLACTSLVLVASNFGQAMGWHALLENMAGRVVAHRPLFEIYMLGQLARYTPGKVGLPLVRLAGATRLGLSPLLVGSSVGIEVLSWLAAGACTGLAALTLSQGDTSWLQARLGQVAPLLLITALLGLLVLNRVDRRRLPGILLKRLRLEGEGPLLPIRVLGHQLLSWFGWLLSGVLLVVGVGGSLRTGLEQSGVFVLAPIAGFLFLVAPGGLGVREAILSLALTPDLGPTRALAAALLARATSIAADLIAFALAKFLAHRA